MRVGILGTGAIADKHAQAYRNIGFSVVACSNRSEERGRAFAERWGARFIRGSRELCLLPDIDFVDVCTYPDTHLEPVEICASIGRPIQLQKPIATNLETARAIVEISHRCHLPISVISQHRFDDATLFLKEALQEGRLGKLLQADAYVKWFRSDEYYARPAKGTWQTEGGGALINQAIHQVDLLLHLFGPVSRVAGMWQLGSRHPIESEDIVNALLRFQSGATGVLQASTAFWPGSTERIEIHGTQGRAIISGDQLTDWSVLGDEQAPVVEESASGASDPMAIAVTSFERQFLNFAEAIRSRRQPAVDAQAGYNALELVIRIYDACRKDGAN